MGMRARFTCSDHIRIYCNSENPKKANGKNESSLVIGSKVDKPLTKGGLDEVSAPLIYTAAMQNRGFALRMFVAALVICTWVVVYQQWSPPRVGGVLDPRPDITIFSAPTPLTSPSNGSLELLMETQELAVRSWLAASPDVSVVLFGRHPSILALAEALGSRVSIESGIDFTFLGTPFFNSMIHKMQAYDSDISVLIDPEITIFPDLITALHKAYDLDSDWLLVSAPQNPSDFPFHPSDTGRSRYLLHNNGDHAISKKFQKLPLDYKRQSNSGEASLLAWNRGSVPLHVGVLPPFLYRKGFHDIWLINEALSSNLRLVIDATLAISSFHAEEGSNYSVEKDRSRDLWERECNSYLASTYGSLYFQNDRELNKVVQLSKCGEKYIFGNISKNKLSSSQVPKSLPLRWDFLLKFLSNERSDLEDKCLSRNGYSAMKMQAVVKVPIPTQITLPFSLKSLVEMVADEHQTVILTIAGESYKDLLMSWVCRLRRLSIQNFLVAALDMETYRFSVLQGLPVFMDPLSPGNISFNDCHFGSICFQGVTKVKSRLVLQILKLGFNVLLSDTDVHWFRNPLPYLRSFGPAVLPAQSDEYKETGPINLPRRLNSGFYFARSDTPTISAIEKVVKHASISGLSEQPSFYDVLCGEGGINRIGDDRCFEPRTNLTVHFLDRDLFPNGAFRGFWEGRHVGSACRKKGCMILHNNWISGRERKLNREVRSGLFAYSSTSRTCLRSFHRGRKKKSREQTTTLSNAMLYGRVGDP